MINLDVGEVILIQHAAGGDIERLADCVGLAINGILLGLRVLDVEGHGQMAALANDVLGVYGLAIKLVFNGCIQRQCLGCLALVINICICCGPFVAIRTGLYRIITLEILYIFEIRFILVVGESIFVVELIGYRHVGHGTIRIEYDIDGFIFGCAV